MLEYVIYADESEKDGEYYSNFYGGSLVRSTDLIEVQKTLDARKLELGFGREVKWRKVTAAYLDRYLALVATFMDLVAAGKIKVRIMFTKNIHVPQNLTKAQRQNAYFLLYYQFIKHAFGLGFSNSGQETTACRFLFDWLPDTREKIAAFKGFLCGLTRSSEFRRARLVIRPDQIAEVDSKQHAILQCLDVILGAIQFRLNNKHLAKAPGAARRACKTVAKDKLYKYISRRIRGIYPGFNIGISTGTGGKPQNRWEHPYRHWLFVPSDHTRDMSRRKK